MFIIVYFSLLFPFVISCAQQFGLMKKIYYELLFIREEKNKRIIGNKSSVERISTSNKTNVMHEINQMYLMQ
jgi:hypothetical protein